MDAPDRTRLRALRGVFSAVHLKRPQSPAESRHRHYHRRHHRYHSSGGNKVKIVTPLRTSLRRRVSRPRAIS